MSRKVLQVIESAYRATIEEQDDTVVWLTHAMKNVGADVAVLLRAHAVNYAIGGQDSSGLVFGGKPQTQPPRVYDDLGKLMKNGVSVFVVAEDVAERGIEVGDLLPGVTAVSRRKLPELYEGYDRIWSW